MKILLVIDGSSYSEMATRMLKALHLPSGTAVTVLTVVPETTFLGGVTLDVIRGVSQSRKKAKEEQQRKAAELLQGTARVLTESKLEVDTLVHWGNPAELILWEAEERNTSLIVMGAKGLTDPLAFRLGSVAQTVMKYARASVLLVRNRPAAAELTHVRKETAAINRVLLAADGSKYSEAVIKFLLELPLPRHCEVIIMTALQSHLMAWVKTPTLDFNTNQELLSRLQTAEEAEAHNITAKAEKQFQNKGYRTASVVIRGGAGESILAAAREYKPDIIALGSRGLSGLEALLLGSVAERVARYADCSVLIGRVVK